MTIGSLFSGIGGLELGLEWAGLGPTVWQVEQNPFCRGVLARHWPEAERFEDVRTVGASVLRTVDLVCGGFPCQDVSSAGKGAGLAGERSGLWREFARIVGELRPRAVVVENVASGARRWLPWVRRDLHLLGYRTRAFALSAADVGAPHLRRRVFVVAADPERVELWEQSGWRGGPNGARPPVARYHGEAGPSADADRELGDARGRGEPGATGRHEPRDRNAAFADADGLRQREPGRGEPAQRRRAGDGGGEVGAWASSAGIRRVAHGLPGRLDRIKALGNAVVPQCAEVVGRIVAEVL